MPDLDEGSFLYMPSMMPHAAIGEALDVIQKQDMAIRAIPEVESVVGKIGRVESALDPAPLSMVETVINYLPEYKTDPVTGERVIDPKTGKPIRNWRPQIKKLRRYLERNRQGRSTSGEHIRSETSTHSCSGRYAPERHEGRDGGENPRKEP